MGQIHVLPPAVADRIAAGEVVERPAAVVRELLDNALDAGGTRIDVDLENGGIDLVSVADDGCGLAPDDAELAFARHATSKIHSGDDLDTVMTLGFRGEALAAIGAVSRVELVSRAAGGTGAGVRVVVERGSRVLVEPASRSPGTTVEVRDLFAGIPARRKFLKAPSTELEHCLAAVYRAALARWEVGFRVRVKGRELLAAAPTTEPQVRIGEILGRRWGDALVETSAARGELGVRAWAGRSDVHRPSRDGLYLYVNRRPVRDPLLMRAVLDAYRHVLPPGRFPVIVLFLSIPPAAVDVNVHPAKSEVRFHRPQDVRGAVLDALEQALGRRAAIPVYGGPVGWRPLENGTVGDRPGLPLAYAPPAWEPGPAVDADGPESPSPQARPAVRAIAQYRNCYIVAEDAQGLLVVDQHVAHERLLYEQLLRMADQGPLPRQLLLFPATLEAGPEAVGIVEREGAALARLGFGVEPFGRTAVVVREVPAILGREATADSFLDVVERLKLGDRAGTEDLFRHLVATVACHSAVRKGMTLSLDKADYILQGLDGCAVPSHCPHGRIISLRVDLSALDRTFDRVS